MDSDLDYADGVELEEGEYEYSKEREPEDYDYDTEELQFNDDGLTLQETVDHCVVPTANDAIAHVGKLLFWCFVLRIVVALCCGRAPRVAHLASALIGCLVLHHFFAELAASFVVHAALSYVALAASSRLLPAATAPLSLLVSLTFVFACEMWYFTADKWHTVRGGQMILVMKTVSVGLDLSGAVVGGGPVAPGAPGSRPAPGPLQYAGYLLHPGTTVFGPWIALDDYMLSMESRPLELLSVRWMVTSVGSLVAGLLFMSISTCWLNYLLPDRTVLITVWIVAYREALAFRCSHYFVSFVSQAAATISGISGAVWSPGGELLVSRPTAIEAPRSLVEVVVNWNLPMHYWLKTYVFRVARPAGVWVAVLCTYVASAVLHGANFQLSAVLLSLGLYTFAEDRLRTQLADALGGCVQARRCVQPCRRHRLGAALWSVRLLNAGLALLAAWHLAYLGMVFDGSPTGSAGYSWRHTLGKWALLGYSSHWVALGTLVVTWLL
ncbi:protein-serine O-palmitoleoyltransferase porcupine-like [Amphibalanus amphitrite]|nr:protein-serine O-palmitoleoyltransferase porcupine-like [Amphibalanus amphitrite]XP_043192606.1 protein-serine O-palmitoleoyltransferase porcupine-like [Amphibalanus amphitrite]